LDQQSRRSGMDPQFILDFEFPDNFAHSAIYRHPDV
jgi:hypothetical protein